ncbi:MAG: cohesin domain-containing protein [Actinomycetes bacterium]
MPSPSHRARVRRSVAVSGAVAVALASFGASGAVAAPSSSPAVVTAPATATVGDVIDVAVSIPGATDVFAFEVDLDFDPALLDYVDGSATGPDGGFTSASVTGGTLTVTSTRLGTSPSLEGDIDAITAQFTVIAAGDATLDLSSLALVGADSAVVTAEDVDATELTLEAAAEPTPEPSSPSPEPSQEPSATPSEEPSATPEPSSEPTASAEPVDDSLSSTGADIALPVTLAALAIVAGLALVLRRKAVQS